MARKQQSVTESPCPLPSTSLTIPAHTEEKLVFQEAIQPVILGNLVAGEVVAASGFAGGQFGQGVAAAVVGCARESKKLGQFLGVFEDDATFRPLINELGKIAEIFTLVDRLE